MSPAGWAACRGMANLPIEGRSLSFPRRLYLDEVAVWGLVPVGRGSDRIGCRSPPRRAAERVSEVDVHVDDMERAGHAAFHGRLLRVDGQHRRLSPPVRVDTRLADEVVAGAVDLPPCRPPVF